MKKLLLVPSIIILAAVVIYSNPAEIAGRIAGSNVLYIFLALLVSLLSLMLRALKWNVLLKKAKYRDVLPVQIFGMTLSNFTPGKIGEPAKALLLKARNGSAVSETLPTIIWERMFDVIVLLFLSISALFLFGLTEFFIIGLAAMSLFLALVVFFIVVIKNKRIGYAAFRLARKLPILNRISEGFVRNFYRSKISKKRLASSFAITIFPWVAEGIVLYLALLSTGISSDPLLLASLIALAELIALASFLPGGLGAFEAVMIVLLSAFSMSGPAAVAGMFIYRFVAFWFSAFVGALSFVHLSRRMDIKNILK